jgi:hypothetical protein
MKIDKRSPRQFIKRLVAVNIAILNDFTLE